MCKGPKVTEHIALVGNWEQPQAMWQGTVTRERLGKAGGVQAQEPC